MTVESIKQAIAELGPGEKTSLAAWLIEQDAAEWDRQMEVDFSPSGPGMALLAEAEADVRAGRIRPMDEFLADEKAGVKTPNSRP
jgi:hypothetical protein